jgi:hypothetical protein
VFIVNFNEEAGVVKDFTSDRAVLEEKASPPSCATQDRDSRR